MDRSHRTLTTDSFDLQVMHLERESPLSTTGSGGFWSTDLPVISDGRLVRGGMFAGQRDWWRLDNFVRLFVGGYGSGKTRQLCKRAIASALQNAPAFVAIVSPTFTMARRTVIATLLELMTGKQSLLGASFKWRFNYSTHELRINYRGRDATLMVLSGEDPQALKGPNIAAAYLDEPFIMDEAVFTQMIARVRHPDARLMEIGLAGTPEQLGWGHSLATKGLGTVIPKNMVDPKLVNSVGVVHASTRDNPLLDPAYEQRLRMRLTPKAAEAYLDGRFVNLTEGRVFYAFDENTNVAELPTPQGVPLAAGMDFNVNPMSAVIFWQAGNRTHIMDEIQLENSDTEYMTRVLRERYGSTLSAIYPDPAGRHRSTKSPGGRSDFYYLEHAGYTVFAPYAAGSVRDSENIVNGLLRSSGSIPSLTISRKCEKLIYALNTYSHSRRHKQAQLSHILDALRYPLTYLNPLPTERVTTINVRGH